MKESTQIEGDSAFAFVWIRQPSARISLRTASSRCCWPTRGSSGWRRGSPSRWRSRSSWLRRSRRPHPLSSADGIRVDALATLVAISPLTEASLVIVPAVGQSGAPQAVVGVVQSRAAVMSEIGEAANVSERKKGHKSHFKAECVLFIA